MNDVDALMDAYENAWNAMNFSALAGLWNHDEAEIYYVAEEIDRPLHKLTEVLDYWEATEALVEKVKLTTTNRRCKSLADDICVVNFEMHMDASMRGAAEKGLLPIGVDVRVSAIVRLAKDGWRFIHYVEAPLGALPFVRRAYNANAREL